LKFQDDLSHFFESHFSPESVHHFKTQFFRIEGDAFSQGTVDASTERQASESEGLGAARSKTYENDNDYDVEYEEDDGLGYYPDGMKRTLTDEQIEMFRHSEIEALRRKEEKRGYGASQDDALIAGDAASGDATPITHEDVGNEEGEDIVQRPSKKKRKKNRNGNGNGQPREPKPDLRKRTWDVVETGLDSLDYD
jgi:hypothetical protein